MGHKKFTNPTLTHTMRCGIMCVAYGKEVGTMSANAQSFAYVFRKKKTGANVNVITKDRLEEIRKRSGKYLTKEDNGNRTRSVS